MSEIPDCPYCGAKVQTDRVLDYDNKVELRCRNCGGVFEFLPGFGSFSLPEHEQRRSIRHEGSRPGFRHDIYEADAPWGIEGPPQQESSCGNCCGVLCCFCIFIPLMMFLLSIIFGFGFFFWWFW